MYEYGWHGAGMVFIWIVPFLILMTFVYLARKDCKQSLTPREILERRYARGEIGTEEYRERLKELEEA